MEAMVLLVVVQVEMLALEVLLLVRQRGQAIMAAQQQEAEQAVVVEQMLSVRRATAVQERRLLSLALPSLTAVAEVEVRRALAAQEARAEEETAQRA